jgi:hypothetical protein
MEENKTRIPSQDAVSTFDHPVSAAVVARATIRLTSKKIIGEKL